MSSEALNLKELGNEAYKKEDYKMALDYYEKAILLVPTEMTFILNSAAGHFQLQNFEECVKSCMRAVKVGRENGADSKLIAKSFARMGRAHKESGNLKMAKLAFEKAQEEHKSPDFGKILSEIESAMKYCQLDENLENLYKVVKIDGKGLGCVALKDIEIGTLILKEKPQCIATPDNVIQSFVCMSKSDQDEYLKLYNAHADPLSKKFAQCAGRQGFSDVFGIYKTNAFTCGLGIKASRFNHSCCSNAALHWNEKDGTGEIRAWSKIKTGKFLKFILRFFFTYMH